MKYSGAEIIIKLLERQGIEYITGIPGGAILPIYNALYKSKIVHILARHEQAGGFIAQGIARSTGKAAVCFATSGPGATNLITAIADAKMDSVPIVAITGQVNSSLIGTDAFQEIDTYGLTVPITKHNFLVKCARDLLYIIPEAFKIAESGRPGPVVVDIPKNVQFQEVEFDYWPVFQEIIEPMNQINIFDMELAIEMINNSKRPILYVGGGLIHSNVWKSLQSLAKKNSIPVTCTLMGLGCYPSDDPLYLGMLGMHGSKHTNLIMRDTDLLISLGVRFDDRATGNLNKFCPKAKVIHMDIDPSEINKNKKTDCHVVGDVGIIIQKMLPYIKSDSRREWLSVVNEMRKKHPFKMPPKQDYLHPLNIIRNTASFLDEDTIITTDVGQHQMWVAQVYPFMKPRTLLTSGGLGTMGFGLPAAIGAAIANPEKRVVCFSGDGSLLMNIHDLATLSDLNLNVKVIVLNNGCLGLVRQQQELFYSGNYIASKFKTIPDFAAVSKAFGIKGVRLDANVLSSMQHIQMVVSETGPYVIDVLINPEENVFPMVSPGAGNYEMIGG
ncbi:biosynthetic-type acetolactate synthase large subunit [Oceanirhabdus seepicola]|uniref:Acetolactate synthase n=1 Tax=Oceanirhabdus seepicola TaxID=2828781 RepID=A0A9J6NZE8_9CLOT|nr:biosynthetic-type acetolactate synthase large subunit [Oceanirhabdus seepicola]MCM1989452.1 biosynthetic-type acetolactate synthase large subunit [Oceanirhabdus seepicola]